MLSNCEYRQSGPHRVWTKEEMRLLVENYKKMTAKELKEKLLPDRTIRAIWGKIERMNLTASRPDWDRDEKQILRDHYPWLGAVEIKKKYLKKRSLRSIVIMASRMHLGAAPLTNDQISAIWYSEECAFYETWTCEKCKCDYINIAGVTYCNTGSGCGWFSWGGEVAAKGDCDCESIESMEL